MADNSLKTLYLGNGFDIDTQPNGPIVGHTFTDADFYESQVNFTGLATSGSQQSLSEAATGSNVQIDVPGGNTAFQDLQEVNQYQIRVTSDDGAGGTLTTTLDAQIFQTADGHLFLVPESLDAASFPTGAYQSIEVLSFQVAATDLIVRNSSAEDLDVPAGVAPGPDDIVDGEDTGEGMGVGYDDSTGANDGGGDLISNSDDTIEGNGGDDTISAGDGNDVISGGSDNDIIDGGNGNDTIYGDDPRAMDSELLSNGSFDGDLSGWTVINPTGGQAPVYSGGGDDFVRLNSGDEAAGGDGISQQFSTIVGETYSTSVSLAQNGGASGNHTVLIEVLDNGGTVIDSVTTVIGPGGSETVDLDFAATSATSEIRFTNPSSTATVNTDVVISNVSVTGLDPADIAGDGDDTIDGGADNDVIYGDGNAVRESLNYEDLTTQQVQDGVTINTGTVDVTFSSPTETGITLATENTASPYTGGIIDDGNGIDTNSILKSTAANSSSRGEYEWGFSEPVTNVSFNIVDLDDFENIQILAYGINGNPIEVILTPGSNVTVSDSNGDGIDDLAEGSTSGNQSLASHAVTVTIPGPVSSIEAIHTLDGGGNLGVIFTETFFDVLAPGPTGDDDIIDGGAGDDTIYGEGGDDTIDGGEGNDTVLAGDGDDTIRLTGTFNDSDSVDGGDGTDTLEVLPDDDRNVNVDMVGGEVHDGQVGGQLFTNIENVTTGGGDDTITGDGAANVLSGGAGNDTVSGGAGDDTIYGEGGDDTLLGGTGDDTLTGGAGDDTFVYTTGDGNDTITDFDTGNSGTLSDGDTTNNDFIDLSAYYDELSELYADQADDGILNQSNDGVGGVDFSDNTSMAGGSLTFTGATADNSFFTFENTGVVCFTSGTAIRTPKGDVLIDDLRVGDLVTTVDNGPQRICWIGRREVDMAALRTQAKLRPVLIQKGVLGASRPLLVSRQHALLLGRDHLIRAAHLTDVCGLRARVAEGKRHVTYIHLMFETHQIIFAENVAAETFCPGP